MTRVPRSTRAAVLITAMAVALSGCDWSTYRGGPAHTGSVGEVTLDLDNVAGLQPEWRTSDGLLSRTSVVAEGWLYAVRGSRLEAYDAAGVERCSGTPKVCDPVWISSLPTAADVSIPAVANGVVYVSQGDGHLFAFDAAGTGCRGSILGCKPLWSAVSHSWLPPTVAGGVVYTAGASFFGPNVLMAFDAAGVERCSGSPKVCLPLWRADPGELAPFSIPTVAHGRAYVAAGDGIIRVFDAAGSDKCSGVPKRCLPIATMETGQNPPATVTVPAVQGGWLYVIRDWSTLQAFDADGTDGCTGSPPSCAPLWTATVDSVRPPAVAGGVVYVSHRTFDGQWSGSIVAFDGEGAVNCSGEPRQCDPLWSTEPATPDGDVSAPIVANGVLYATSHDELGCPTTQCDIRFHLLAWDAAGAQGCSGVPVRCAPVLDWTHDVADTPTYPPEDLVLADSRLYVHSLSHADDYTAFALPSE